MNLLFWLIVFNWTPAYGGSREEYYFWQDYGPYISGVFLTLVFVLMLAFAWYFSIRKRKGLPKP